MKNNSLKIETGGEMFTCIKILINKKRSLVCDIPAVLKKRRLQVSCIKTDN